MSKYHALTRHLAARDETRVAMSFAELEKVLGFTLPNSARTYRPWWANSDHGHVQARGWLDAGFQSQDVDLEAQRLLFVRMNESIPGKAAGTGPDPSASGQRRHPLIGCMFGTITIAPGVDLSEPGAGDWDEQTLAKFDSLIGTAK